MMMDAKTVMETAIRMPTPEEHRRVSLQWLERIQPTLIDQWPAEIASLSMPTKMIELDVPSIWNAFGMVHDGKAEDGMPDALNSLAREIDEIVGWKRHFIRLNSRSPKDWPWPFDAPATISGKEAVSMLVDSERVINDLLEFKYVPEQPAYVCLREWVHWIRGENEFRCFVKDGELIAVTHYDYRKSTPLYVVEQAAELRAVIDGWFTTHLKPALHIDTVVFDIAIRGDGEVILIELNPYGRSDPCWFGSYEAVENASSRIETGTVDA